MSEDEILKLAVYCGKVVPHVETVGTTTVTRGRSLRESYVLALLRLCNPDMPEPATTTMGENNWVLHRFRTDELLALARATPEQRAEAANRVIARYSKPPPPQQQTGDGQAAKD